MVGAAPSWAAFVLVVTPVAGRINRNTRGRDSWCRSGAPNSKPLETVTNVHDRNSSVPHSILSSNLYVPPTASTFENLTLVADDRSPPTTPLAWFRRQNERNKGLEFIPTLRLLATRCNRGLCSKVSLAESQPLHTGFCAHGLMTLRGRVFQSLGTTFWRIRCILESRRVCIGVSFCIFLFGRLF